MSDWRFDLPNNCTMWRNSSDSIMVSYYNNSTGAKSIGIPNIIIDFFFNERYVLAKTILPSDFEKYLQRLSVEVNYYIFDTIKKETVGPLTEKIFFELLTDLAINKYDIIWITTSQRPIDAYQVRDGK
jgi:hypothetical protein